MKPFFKNVDCFLIPAFFVAILGQVQSVPAAPSPEADSPGPLTCLMQTYGAYIERVEGETGAPVLVMKDGTRFRFDDGKTKSFDSLLSTPDLEDQFAFPYPQGDVNGPPAINADPGRIRVEGFFASVYGRSEAEVRKRLVPVDWPAVPKKRVLFNREMGASAAVSKVGRELFEKGGAARRIARAVGGTFNHRTIAGTHRLSAHGFGIAVDVDVHNSSYWRWSKTFPIFTNNIPRSVVDIFEQNGFIWGGKWYHFDTMHFEFRPEMFCGTSNGHLSSKTRTVW